MPEFGNVVVVGLGYIGLPTAAVIASRGKQVFGVDVNEHVVKTVASGSIHIAEPDLEGLVQKVVSSGSLKVATEPREADVFIIAVPTPIDEQKRADLKSVMNAVDTIAGVLRAGNLVILESTVPIGTTEQIAKKIAQLRPDLTIGMSEGASTAFRWLTALSGSCRDESSPSWFTTIVVSAGLPRTALGERSDFTRRSSGAHVSQPTPERPKWSS